MSKYTDFYPASVASSFPYTGSATITGSLAVTGSGNFEYKVEVFAWSSAPSNMIISRQQLAGAGTQAAAVAFGGVTDEAGVNLQSATEEYNSGTWSPGGNMNIARRTLGGVGTQTNALAFAGAAAALTGATEEYSSEVWTSKNTQGTRSSVAGAGTQTAAVSFGGSTNPTAVATTQLYNSGNWSPAANMITARRELMGAGTQTAALSFGGQTPTLSGVTEEFTSGVWTPGGTMGTPRVSAGASGTQTAALTFGGKDPAQLSTTEEYNSSIWSATPANLIIARHFLGGTGTQTAALAFGGINTPTVLNSTEQYTAASSTPTNGFNFDSVTGDTTVLALVQTSAGKHKKNIEPLGSQMSKIGALRPVRYNWKDITAPEEIGFIAEEVQKIYPELVGTDAAGKVNGINYAKMVSVLVKSVQEQQEEIDLLNNELDNLIK